MHGSRIWVPSKDFNSVGPIMFANNDKRLSPLCLRKNIDAAAELVSLPSKNERLKERDKGKDSRGQKKPLGVQSEAFIIRRFFVPRAWHWRQPASHPLWLAKFLQRQAPARFRADQFWVFVRVRGVGVWSLNAFSATWGWLL